MKAFILFAVLAVAYAAPEGGYSYPSAPSQGFSSSSNSGGNFGNGGSFSAGGQTFRHVYVHVAPDEPEDRQARVIRVPGGQDKHVNIIFVKAPSSSASQQTEVILPEQDEQKTIVYVLKRQFNPETDLKIRAPRPTTPPKPDVYFIRYKDQQGQTNNNAQQGISSSVSGSQGVRPVYGAPFQSL